MRILLFMPAVLALSSAVSAQVQITGAGATFPNPIYQKWFSDFHKAHPDVQINYQAIGSGGGIKQITEGTVDFGASDAIMTDEQIAEFKRKRGTGLLALPTVAGADVATYNIPGIPSGLSPEWKSKVGAGAAVNWPTGIGAKGNDGVAGQVKQTANSIGYVELIYAEKQNMPYGNVKNSAGIFVKPELASITAAAAGAAKTMPDDFRISITNSPGKTAYPISTFTWLLIPEQIQDPAKGKAIKEFVHWALAAGQDQAEPMTYARLPKEVIGKELKAFAKVK